MENINDNMKKINVHTAFYVLLLMLTYSCSLIKSEEYVFPKEMKPHVKEDYLSMCMKGRVLYEQNCAKCHNTGRRKQVIPEFNNDQLIGYALRTSNRDHESSIQDTIVTEEELVLIMHFLNYRKK
jgi:hypothetical protein